MKLLAESSSSFRELTDKDIRPETSIVGRYRNAIRFDELADRDRALKKFLQKTSINEGARVIRFMHYRDVDIHILDETSLMASGTLKSLDGCLTTAFCLNEGVQQTAFESGGNTGSALTRYGQRAGLETFFFCPLVNIDLLDSTIFDNSRAHLLAVEDRGKVKELTRLFAATTGMRHVPEKSWRTSAAMFRGLFILEQLLYGRKYDWLSQTVSAGFGPIGIYSILRRFRPELGELPRFLGIQQEANCPMFAMWKPEAAKRLPSPAPKQKELLTRVMYDETPQTYRTYEDLKQLLVSTGGDLLTLNQEEFESHLSASAAPGNILEQLAEQEIPITLREGEILEKTGIIALLGTLKAIETGTIPAGSSVLCCLTSGVSKADGKAQPETTVRDQHDVLRHAGMITGGQ